MIIAEALELFTNAIYDIEGEDSLECLIPSPNFEMIKDEYLKEDLTRISDLYQNIGAFKCYGKIFYGEEHVGIVADGDIFSSVSREGLGNCIKIVSIEGQDVIKTTEDCLAFMEDDDDDDPDTGFFYFIGIKN